MDLDPELLRQLIESFGTELKEHTHSITNGLLSIEKNTLSQDEYHKTIETIFRAAHNIKGTAYSIGINQVGEIAHSIESIFAEIKKTSGSVTHDVINSCLDSVDKMQNAWQDYQQESKPDSPVSTDDHDYDSTRVSNDQIEKIYALLEEMQIQGNHSTLLHSLREEVSQLRMIPVGNLLCTLPRYVRDISHELGKKVELVMKGESVRIDKAVLEGLKDPIVHVLRNAIDHGIELPHVRKAQGKSETGHIRIDITEEHASIHIAISDDGSGIDVDKLSITAVKNQWLTKETLDKMTEAEKLELVFRPGFTTKENVTDLSGRGVGLDVVKANIEKLKGEVHLSTVPRQKTEIVLTVPVSIASERGLLVRSGGELFVIPTAFVERVLWLNVDDIIQIQGGQGVSFHHKTIPFRRLSDSLNLDRNAMIVEKKLSVMVIRHSSMQIAFWVDEIIGEREIVVKSLREPFSKIPCISGGTLLESNQVVMVLEPADLIKYAMKETAINAIELNKNQKKLAEKKHILVVDDSITTRTLEKNVLESKNYQVTVAVNGKEAWNILQKQKFSLVITDVMMPVMDGFTLTEHVKTSQHLRDLPVIIVTSLGSEAEKKRGIEVGADAYVVKNEFESGALLSIVSQLV